MVADSKTKHKSLDDFKPIMYTKEQPAALRLRRFDSKNPEDGMPAKFGQYVPVLSFLKERGRKPYLFTPDL